MPHASRFTVALALVTLVTILAGCSSSGSTATSTGAGGGSGSGSGDAQVTASVTPKQLFPSDFDSVCSGGTVSRATAYDPAKPGPHKTIHIIEGTDGKTLIESTSDLPEDWRVTFDANSNAYASIELVACLSRTAETFVKDCTGYEVDDKPSDNVAKLYDAQYQLSVKEATTGKELGSTTLTASETDCPMFETFKEGEKTINDYATPASAEVVAFVKPFVTPTA